MAGANMGMSTYIITGRVPDKENEAGWYKAKSYAEAISLFIKDIKENHDAEEIREIIESYGVLVYVDSVFETKGEPLTHYSGWGAMSDEAKKYEKRKTVYQR